jgi:hypothetical protein
LVTCHHIQKVFPEPNFEAPDIEALLFMEEGVVRTLDGLVKAVEGASRFANKIDEEPILAPLNLGRDPL